MKKITLVLATALLGIASANAQEQTPLVLSGSVDAYLKADPSGKNNQKTSFGGNQSTEDLSLNLGMVNLVASKEYNKGSFVADISFGPRSNETLPQSGQFNIQNLYMSYQFSDVVSTDVGFMGTFVGYEVISPASNFNYSASYLFSNGPFQNSGVKLNIAPSEVVDFMVGAFNNTDSYSNTSKTPTYGAQVHLAPTEGLDLYVNYLDQNDSYRTVDLTAGFQASDDFYVGLNAAKNWATGPGRTGKGNHFEYDNHNFWGVAVYPQYAISDVVTLGLRYEHFVAQGDFGAASLFSDVAAGNAYDGSDVSIESVTLSANVSLGGELTFIPEVRADFASEDIFSDADNKATGYFLQFGAAAVYAF